jgi:hypothetical protein
MAVLAIKNQQNIAKKDQRLGWSMVIKLKPGSHSTNVTMSFNRARA